jgi:hypothetical protein
MDKFLRTALLVLGIVVLAALLFNLGIQLYGMIAGPAFGAYGAMAGPMMGGRGTMHAFGGFGLGFLGPILGMALVGLIVAGIVALVRGGQGSGPA